MAENQYFVLHLSEVDHLAEDWLGSQAFAFGALGVSEVLPFHQPEGEEDVFVDIPERRQVDVYFAKPPSAEFMETLRSRFPEVQARVSAEQDKDWLAEWKKGFKPFPLVGGHWVVPSWCEPPAEATHKIWIDPGMAFGTGTHETTRLVAEALGDIVPRDRSSSLLDVGTGTGILAILARQLGVATVHATEIEADSRRVAKENFALNHCADVRLDERQVEALSEKYDIVVANIIDGVLVRLQDALKARVKPGGWLLLSGIIGERVPDFEAGFVIPPSRDGQSRTWDIRIQQGDWLLYGLKV